MTPPIMISVPMLAPSLNRYRAMHWTARSKLVKEWVWAMRLALGQQIPPRPFERAAVTIWRHSTRPLDVDSLMASAKIPLDVLQPISQRHPYGLGVIADDRADSCRLDVRWIKKARRIDQKTILRVEDITGLDLVDAEEKVILQ